MKLYKGISEVIDDYDAFFLDIWGVLHNGVYAYPETNECLENILNHGKKICLVSNTPRREEQIKIQNELYGIPKNLYHNAKTAGGECFKRVKEFEGKKCLFMGSDLFMEIINDVDLELVDSAKEADFILNAISGTSIVGKKHAEEHLKEAIKYDVPMLCANPDLVVHVGDELLKCAGSYAKIYEDMGGNVEYFGKPYESIYNSALEAVGKIDKSRILAVGDSLLTDIKGANNFGIDCLFNLIGIHKDEINTESGQIDFDKVTEFIDKQKYVPTGIIEGFKW